MNHLLFSVETRCWTWNLSESLENYTNLFSKQRTVTTSHVRRTWPSLYLDSRGSGGSRLWVFHIGWVEESKKVKWCRGWIRLNDCEWADMFGNRVQFRNWQSIEQKDLKAKQLTKLSVGCIWMFLRGIWVWFKSWNDNFSAPVLFVVHLSNVSPSFRKEPMSARGKGWSSAAVPMECCRWILISSEKNKQKHQIDLSLVLFCIPCLQEVLNHGKNEPNGAAHDVRFAQSFFGLKPQGNRARMLLMELRCSLKRDLKKCGSVYDKRSLYWFDRTWFAWDR